MSEQIEAVARAICMACEENPDHKGDARGNVFRWQDYKDVATAAIAASQQAAPKAVLTDEQILKLWNDAYGTALKEVGFFIGNSDAAYMKQPIVFARAIIATAGPNAALVDALQQIANLKHYEHDESWDIASAALASLPPTQEA